MCHAANQAIGSTLSADCPGTVGALEGSEGYTLACVEDVKRVCQAIEPGDGRILQCLQEHEQDLSEGCYQSLPKGRLNLRN